MKAVLSVMKASKSSEKPWFDKRHIMTVIFLSISLSFTVFFFSPMDIFLWNQKSFFVGAALIAVPMLLISVAVSIELMLIGVLLLKRKNAFNVVTSILFGLLMVFYTQMILFNGNMQILNGEDNSYGSMNAANILNSVIMCIIFILPLILTMIRDKINRSDGIINFAKGKVIPYISVLIFLMQLLGIINSLASNKLINSAGTMTGNAQYFLSYKPVMSLSKEKNIVVFLMDKLDGNWMDETLEKYPELNDKLDGFTYYRNNISEFKNTYPSVISMLTDVEYDYNKNTYDNIHNAWLGNTIPSILNENGYKIYLLIDQATTYNDSSDLSDCDNFTQIDVEYAPNYYGNGGIIPTMVNLSLLKLSPYFLKEMFSANISQDNPTGLFLYSYSPDQMPASTSIATDIKFYSYFRENGLTSDAEQKTFSFIHLNGAHDDSKEISRWHSGYPDTEADTITTIRGEFEMLIEYFDDMKKLGIYDNSTIIIVADHGQLLDLSTSTLLIKPEGAISKPLETDSEAELSNTYFFASILEYAGIDHSEYGYSYNDIIANNLHIDRYTWLYDSTHFFRVTGNARNASDWEEISLDN